MGGFSPSWERSPPPPDRIKENIEAFLRVKTFDEQQKYLTEAINHYKTERETDGFISRLVNLSGKRVAMGGLSGIEVELKLNVPSSVIVRDESLDGALRAWDLSDSRFYKDNTCATDSTENIYFGTQEEEKFVVIRRLDTNGSQLKFKEAARDYTFGIESEEYVLRRAETMKKTASSDIDLLSLTERMVALFQPTEIKNHGSMHKEKATQWILDTHTGRVYSLVLSKCTVLERDPLLQLEIEYAGYIPVFIGVNDYDNEKKIVKDVLGIADHFKTDYGLELTKLTKFDWLVGRKVEDPIESKREEEVYVNLMGEQHFFGDEI